jgi:hypothetical protein
MKRWIDLDEPAAAEAKAGSLAAGLGGVSVCVAIAEPDRRQRRLIEVAVDAKQPETCRTAGALTIVRRP